MKLQQQSHATLKSKLQDHKTTQERIKRMSGWVLVLLLLCVISSTGTGERIRGLIQVVLLLTEPVTGR